MKRASKLFPKARFRVPFPTNSPPESTLSGGVVVLGEGRALPTNPSVACGDCSPFRGAQLVKKGFDKLVDGEASSPATATLTSLR